MSDGTMSNGHFYSLDGPLDSVPVDRQLRAANLTGFTELVRTLGADPRRILDRHGIDPAAMRDPDSYIDAKSLIDVLEYCSSLFNDPLFGLHLGQLQEPEVFGAVTALCRSAATVREALTSFIEFIPVVHCPVAALELVEGEEVSELRWHVQTNVGSNDQANYKATLMKLKLLRQISGRAFNPLYINLTVNARRQDMAELSEQLGCKVGNRASSNVFAFPTAALNRSVTTSNRTLFRLIGGYLDRVRDASRRSLVERVEDYVRGYLPAGNCSTEHCARKLGTSVRTLQTKLSTEGRRFSDIVEEQRISLAKIHLEKGGISLDDLSFTLGYADHSSFGRAFKRWTGTTPKQYRRSLDLRSAA